MPTEAKARDYTSYSELSSFASCEQKWWNRYIDKQADEPSAAMSRGTDLHEAIDQWWRGTPWERSDDETVNWLMVRYNEHYGPMRDEVEVLQSELELRAPLANGRELLGYVDGLYSWKGMTWLVERKSMKDWSRLAMLDADLQISLYAWLARENGIQFDGLIYDAIKTFHWKQPRPASESFDFVLLDRTDDQMDAAAEWADNTYKRMTSTRTPVKNFGTFTCRGCNFVDKCREELAWGTQTIEIEE